jgi:hypothetical protein
MLKHLKKGWKKQDDLGVNLIGNKGDVSNPLKT